MFSLRGQGVSKCVGGTGHVFACVKLSGQCQVFDSFLQTGLLLNDMTEEANVLKYHTKDSFTSSFYALIK